jgi:hypothetical protein
MLVHSIYAEEYLSRSDKIIPVVTPEAVSSALDLAYIRNGGKQSKEKLKLNFVCCAENLIAKQLQCMDCILCY